MRVVIQYRLPAWQVRIFREFAEEQDVSLSSLSRFAFNYVLLRYDGKITRELMDEVEFEARKRFLHKQPSQPVVAKPKRAGKRRSSS